MTAVSEWHDFESVSWPAVSPFEDGELCKIRMAEKTLNIKSSTLNVANLAMIFKLDPCKGVHIHSDEGEIVLPDSMGSFIM